MLLLLVLLLLLLIILLLFVRVLLLLTLLLTWLLLLLLLLFRITQHNLCLSRNCRRRSILSGTFLFHGLLNDLCRVLRIFSHSRVCRRKGAERVRSGRVMLCRFEGAMAV